MNELQKLANSNEKVTLIERDDLFNASNTYNFEGIDMPSILDADGHLTLGSSIAAAKHFMKNNKNN